MFQSFFNGLSGMLSFSKGIDVVSQNISNMNTPGYKASTALFQDLSGGIGAQVVGTSLQTQSGEYSDSGSSTTLAIEGNGFFVLRNDDGEFFYTRAGQFRFDEDGQLVDEATGKNLVMSIDESGNLIPFDINALRIRAPEATTSVNMIGNLSSTDGTHEIDGLSIFDIAGETHDINIRFERVLDSISEDTWTVEFLDESDQVLGEGEIRFNADGSPLEGFSNIEQTFTLNGEDVTVNFSFGEPDEFGGATQFSTTTSNLGASIEDGSAVSGFSSIEFDEKGIIQITYTNGEETEGPQLALATFNDVSQLDSIGSGAFTANSQNEAEFSRPDEGIAGTIVGSKLELSNTELTEQFAQLLIAQQGYSASSRVMTVANQLIETLYGSTGGR